MKKLKRVQPVEAAVEQIEWYIQKNQLKPHAKLPGEREMCEVWNLNRSTLRSAIARLVEERVLYSEKGSGTYVAPPRLERNLQDLKSTTEAMRGTGYFLWTEVLHSGIEECDKYIAAKLEIPIGTKVFYLKRLRIRNNIPLIIESSYIDYGRCENIEKHNFSEESLYKVLRDSGIVLEKGEESIEITYATEREASLLKVEPGQYMFYISGCTKDPEGKPVEFFKNVANPDQILFTSTLKRL
ncbi:MAG: GntR family transcriptional regulator [Dorea sp.]|nr:GntR family transcriptional regulator [Dorea sp.]